MISVTAVRLEELTYDEQALIVQYCRKCFEPVEPSNVVARVRDGSAVVYRFTGDSDGVFILARGDNGLYIETVAGKNVVKHFNQIYEKIRTVATAAGAKNLYSLISRPALQRLYSKTRAHNVATLYRETLR